VASCTQFPEGSPALSWAHQRRFPLGNSWALSSQPTYGDPSANPNAWYYDGSGGGGVSTAYAQPWYQRGVVPSRLATDVPEGSTNTPMRVIPDVSALADPSTGVLVGQTTLQPDGKTCAFALSRIGGTSVASPVFAGIEADAQQAAGHDLGFANPAIYARYVPAGDGNQRRAELQRQRVVGRHPRLRRRDWRGLAQPVRPIVLRPPGPQASMS
jgi:hypothetical protein